MSSSRSGPPVELIRLLRRSFKIADFVETGTLTGATARWAAGEFDRVTTVEKSEHYHRLARTSGSDLSNVRYVLGDSRDALRGVVAALSGPALFWLDAHWSGGLTVGEGDECPVLEEIRIIGQSGRDHFVLIDDARLFLSAPPEPHSADEWPTIVELVQALTAGHALVHVAIIEDFVIAVPPHAQAAVIDYCRQVNGRAWQSEPARRPRNPLRELSTEARTMVRSWLPRGART